MKTLHIFAMIVTAFSIGGFLGLSCTRESQHIAKEAIDVATQWKSVSDKNESLLHKCLSVPRAAGKSRYRPQHVNRKNGWTTITPDSNGLVTIVR